MSGLCFKAHTQRRNRLWQWLMDRGLIHDLLFFHLDGFCDVQVHQSQKHKFNPHLLPPPPAPPAPQPTASPWAKVSCHWWNDISVCFWAVQSVEREDANSFSATHDCNLYLKSDLMPRLRSCVVLFTGNMQGNISAMLAPSFARVIFQ